MGSGETRSWLLLAYKVPREPSATRVYVWRKLKKLGAVALQDAVWVLPNAPGTREQLQWLSSEIAELHGEATLWKSSSLLAGQHDHLVKQFESAVQRPYSQMLAGLKKK